MSDATSRRTGGSPIIVKVIGKVASAGWWLSRCVLCKKFRWTPRRWRFPSTCPFKAAVYQQTNKVAEKKSTLDRDQLRANILEALTVSWCGSPMRRVISFCPAETDQFRFGLPIAGPVADGEIEERKQDIADYLVDAVVSLVTR